MDTMKSFFDRKLQQVMDRSQVQAAPDFGMSPATYVGKWKRAKELVNNLATRTRPEGAPAQPPSEDLSVHVLYHWAAELAALLDELARAEDEHGYYDE